MNEVLFSIILPTFNREKLIKRAIQSVIDQTYKNWELIIIDNYSSDQTEKVVKNFYDSRIIYKKFNNNGIIAKSRNYGIKQANGDYIAFLDSDDWWYVKKLALVVKCIKMSSAMFIYHNMHVYYSLIKKKNKIKYTRNLSNPYIDLLYKGPAFATSSVVLNKKIFNQICLFNESEKFLAWEDFDAWLRFSKVSNSFYFIDQFLGCTLIGDHNTLNSSLKKKNIILFKQKYFNNVKISKIPFWCKWALMRIFFDEKKFNTSFKICKNLIKQSSARDMPKILYFCFLSFFLKC